MKLVLWFLLALGPMAAFSSSFGEGDGGDLSGLIDKNITADTDCTTNKNIFSGMESKSPFLATKEDASDGSKTMEIKK